ncbi:hypothetical protein NW754_001851 [Fusarium falciforme]|nr:hypothetical protein NW754_001851 [Fusarium falciforme]
MLIINTILLALHATIGASAPVLDGDRMQVEHHSDKSTYWYLPEHNPTITKPEHLGLRVIVQAVKGPERVDKAMKGKASRGGCGYQDYGYDKGYSSTACLTAIEASLSSIPKCMSATGDEIEISTDGVEVDADGLPVCLDKAGQDALDSIQNALTNLGDCATATPLSRT